MLSDDTLRRLGIQPRPFRALFRTFVTMDLRGQFYAAATNAKPGEVISPLFWVVGQLLVVSLLLCAVLQGRVEAWFYASAHLGATCLFVFSAIVVEFQEAAYDPADVAVMGHRPVTGRTWSAARLLNLSMYVALISTALTLFPTFMGLGLRDTDASWLLLYPWAATVVSTGTAAAALLLYATSGIGAPGENLRRVAAWVQIIAILVLFYGGQLMLRNATGGLESFAFNPPPWVTQLPTTWLAYDVAGGGYRWLAAGSLLSTGLVYGALYSLRRAWSRVARIAPVHPVANAPSASHPSPVSNASSTLFPSRHERAIFGLTLAMLSRDGELRSRNLPALTLAISAAILGPLIGQYSDPMSGHHVDAVMPVATTILLASAIPTLLNNLSYSRSHEAVWRLQPRWGDRAARAVGVAVHTRIFLPLLTAHGLFIGLLWRDALAAVVYTVIAALILDLVMRLCSRSLLRSPILRRPLARGATVGSISTVVAGVSALASTLGGLWFFVAPYPFLLGGFAGVLFVAAQSVPRGARP